MLPGLKERLLGLINDPAYTPLKKEELAFFECVALSPINSHTYKSI